MIFAALATSATAQTPVPAACSAATLSGAYGFTINGFVTSTADPEVLQAQAEVGTTPAPSRPAWPGGSAAPSLLQS